MIGLLYRCLQGREWLFLWLLQLALSKRILLTHNWFIIRCEYVWAVMKSEIESCISVCINKRLVCNWGPIKFVTTYNVQFISPMVDLVLIQAVVHSTNLWKQLTHVSIIHVSPKINYLFFTPLEVWGYFHMQRNWENSSQYFKCILNLKIWII